RSSKRPPSCARARERPRRRPRRMPPDSEPPTRPDGSQPGECPSCGWRIKKERNGGGRCIDAAECAHRMVLEQQGRPRSSGCRCLTWPCVCKCHGHPADPMNGVQTLPHEPP
ncbi:MAG: hypothetical protein ACREU5_12695, partial [Burkholderiales bacterium]